MNQLLWHFKLSRIYGFIVCNITFCFWDWYNHIIPLLSIYLLCWDSPLEMMFLLKRKKKKRKSTLKKAKSIFLELRLESLTHAYFLTSHETGHKKPAYQTLHSQHALSTSFSSRWSPLSCTDIPDFSYWATLHVLGIQPYINPYLNISGKILQMDETYRL